MKAVLMIMAILFVSTIIVKNSGINSSAVLMAKAPNHDSPN